MFGFFQCRTIPRVPTSAATNVIISAPEGFNSCYLRHQQSGASTDNISVVVNVKTFFYNGQKLEPLGDPQVITVNLNNTPFPTTVIAQTPNDGTAGAIEVTMQGVECSECAGGYGSNQEPQQACNVTPMPGGGYRAARPQWTRTIRLQQYYATANFGSPTHIPNVSNTCGCLVY